MILAAVTVEDMESRESLFETAIRDHQKSLARIVATYELDSGLQQELHQEILLAIWKSLVNFRGDSRLHTFIFKVAHNQAINHVSRHAKQPQLETLDATVESQAAGPRVWPSQVRK